MAYVLQRGKGGVSDEERWKARLPEVVVFSIELFHILYLTACLQGQQITVWATVGVALFDATGSVMSVRRLLRRSKMEMIVGQSNNSHQSGGPVVGLLDDVNQPPQSLKAFNSSPVLPTFPSMRSVVPASVSKLLTIDSVTSARFSNRRRSSIMSFSATRRLSMTVETIANLKLAKRSSSRTSSYQSGKTAPRSVSRATNIDRKNQFSPQQNTGLSTEDEVARLESLSMTEYFLLVEYVKCIIPVMYGIFQVVLARLPNAVFYPSLANVTPQDLNRAQTNMAVFVSLKALSLMAFVLLLHCRLRFSVAHQLSFVLETAADDIQVKLAMLIPYCFFFFLDHNGVDYTFRFAWMDNR
ncbi:hypothetical protein P3T76_014463 [Phytophthora citrophthora]|uniref:Transmembrane protein n=1 Tax=Phytophthora citrophthora TaxID=4793 RepID=A0AAD9G1B7_9STRA|nr:hypothetical protein P3T76_014463 [Phytophthora citrophthora]